MVTVDLGAGPTGTGAPSSSRVHLSARSPLTGFIGSSNVGGTCGTARRALDIDTLELRGHVTHPAYLYVDETAAELRDPGDLWGLDTAETANRLREIHAGTRAAMLLICPAGERAVPLALHRDRRGPCGGSHGSGSAHGGQAGQGRRYCAPAGEADRSPRVFRVRETKDPALKLVNDYGLENEADLVIGLTGRTVTGAGLFTVGERIVNAERLLNFVFGASPEDDTLPAYFTDTQVAAGPSVGSRVDLAPMLSEFYALMGWTARGYRTQETLESLGLGDFAPAPAPARCPAPAS